MSKGKELIDPQDERRKQRSRRLEISSRSQRKSDGGWIPGRVRVGVYGLLAIIPAALMSVPDAETVRYLAIFGVWAITLALWWRALRGKSK